VVVAAHDAGFLRETCDEIYVVGSGAVRRYEGGVDDYVAMLSRRIEAGM
jgi:ATPase subunit of ABC transporter with duplicated ATPase domains